VRIFVSKEAVFSDYIDLLDDQFHHLSRVLRIKLGNKLDVVVDQHILMVIDFIKFQDKRLYYKLIQRDEVCLSRPQITLFQALPKQDKFMSIIDGVTQCGVAEIYPILTDRSVVKFTDVKKKERVLRWQKQVEQSAMQSKQIQIPIIHSILNFSDFLDQVDFSSYDLCVVAWEDELQVTVKPYLADTLIKKIGVFIGPEGGISSNDIVDLQSKGFKIMSIGSTILRVDIAAIVAISQILFFYL
tara:strand:- start:3963 stop:4691 length:729 start_codon:yes stop_codon:yes gene_type:complete